MTSAQTPPNKVISLRIPPQLNKRVEDVAKKVGLKKSVVLRLSTERGLDVLLAQLVGKKP